MPTLPGLSYLDQFYGGNQLQNLFASIAPPPIVQTQQQATGQGTVPNPTPPPATPPAPIYTPLTTTGTAPSPWTKGGITQRGSNLPGATSGSMFGVTTPWNPLGGLGTQSVNEAQYRSLYGAPNWNGSWSSYNTERQNWLDQQNAVNAYGVPEYYAPFGNVEYNMFSPTYAGPNARITPFMQRSLATEFAERGLSTEQLASFLLDPVAWTQQHPTVQIPGATPPAGPTLSTGTTAAATNNYDPAGLINLLTEAVGNLGYNNQSSGFFHPYGPYGGPWAVPTAGAPNLQNILARLGLG